MCKNEGMISIFFFAFYKQKFVLLAKIKTTCIDDILAYTVLFYLILDDKKKKEDRIEEFYSINKHTQNHKHPQF